MFEERTVRKQFLSAPPSIGSTIASLLEPLVAAGMLGVFHEIYGYRMDGVAMALAILLLVLMFPGVNRFGRTGVGVGIDIILSWVWVLSVLALLGYATNSLSSFDTDMLIAWGIATPLVQWGLVAIGTAVQRHLSSLPDARRPAVIIGAGRMGMRVAQMLHQRKSFGHDLLGFFDDRSADRVNLPEDATLVGALRQLPEFIETHGVKDVFITLPLTSQPRIQSLLESLQNTTASIHFVPDIFGVSVIQGRLEDMGGVPVVGLMVAPFTGINGFVKRSSDIVLSTLILLLISPVLVVLALGVKMSSPGPVIFRQRRTGLDGEIIEVYKFRSMRATDNGPVVKQATRDDPRITPFGAFIRKTSLDELPQFVNVLQGRMSIVGPRPHAVAHNEQYRKLVKAYMARHKVKPGITGWAQVNGLRGETDTLDKMAARIEFDLEYLRNWTLGLDLLIIAKTVKLVFLDRSAY
ncbi:undecaprenyl-phosphate glucose phosphotransferase [Scleromatobacter humisilvae]|uniref:Undecaprenyl-phosphate glucose phosphotransferase n=1 Tax=Scleromatobacter humisilvae TaxID=2897159 RepID=A0A9X1YQ71_9BURK|nr:undecaprenyl-phosphate glucose phosphotransferase [Scleromatobacter humisilvae]MCK9685851.1 undecaprenyl-phosphate glucose phosphotransferase [Scleromatobacter humisilvae]